MKNKTILLLGGYGSVGRYLAKLILQELEADLIIAGRRLFEAEKFATALKTVFPNHNITARLANASDANQLKAAFSGVDLVIVLTTTPEYADIVAETALESGCDYLDIFVSASTWHSLEKLGPRIIKQGRTFITQAGFHPGLPAVFVREAAQYFDRYDEALIAMAMNTPFDTPGQVAEIMPMLTEFNASIFENGAWQKATYRDSIRVKFDSCFGEKSLYPFEMIELRNLPAKYGLKRTGVFISGFSWLVDNVLMPIMMLVNGIFGKRSWPLLERWFVWGVNTFLPDCRGVIMQLDAKGEKDGRSRSIRISAWHEDAYLFTVIAIIACLKQFYQGIIPHGLHMMGRVVDPGKLFAEIEALGCQLKKTL